MAKGLPRSRERGIQSGASAVVKQTIRLNHTLNVADGAPGFGSVAIGDFPQGNILFLGATIYPRFTTASANVIAAFDGDYSLGTTPTADNALAGTDVNLVASTALGAATAKVSPIVRGAGSTAAMFDNTDGSLELNLNLLIDDTSISGAAAFTVTGVLSIAYIVLGDD